MTRTIVLCSILALAACDPGPMQQGAGFGSYDPYSASRESALRGGGPVLVEPPSAPQVITGDELAAAGIGSGAGADGAAAGSAFGDGTGIATGASPPAVPAAPGTNVGISDEQSFEAVSSRETIQSDAERLAAQRQAYRVIEPEPLPERPRDTGPNIVAFALSTTNQPGERIYSRSGVLAETRFNRNCGKYASSDLAQQAFLENGGPQRDRLGLDPDGDGFACYWDPRPFRTARGN